MKKDKLITDPGIGFGKNYEENLFMMNKLETLRELGCPVLLGTSRSGSTSLPTTRSCT